LLLKNLCYYDRVLYTDVVSIGQRLAWFSEPRPSHIAHFYALDEELVNSLLEYIGRGLAQGDTCIVIARPRTLITLNKKLRAAGADIAAALQAGQYVTHDAEELLALFMRHGLPDPQGFSRTVGEVVSSAAGRGKPVRAFGEMVTILLEQQYFAGMIDLEEYWNALMGMHDFSLYCAYPEYAFRDSPRYEAAFRAICACHNEAVGCRPVRI
jgi:hypothetical protein